ncbi:hypothetical protein C8R44DRAFT_879851 [Mycena epipterygia]|nr:hypothetical protein C8R44DRAFT_879851 [Mycena epipterygia]
MDEGVVAMLRRIQRFQKLQQAHTGPAQRDDDALRRQADAEITKEEKDAVYYPPESPKGRQLRDTVLALDELMSEIFAQCLPIEEFTSPSQHHAPLLLAQAILPYSHRWERVRLELEPSSFRTLAVLRGRIPLLRHFFIKFPISHNETELYESPPSVLDAFEIAPSLRSVAMKNPPNLDLRLPFPQLSILRIFPAPTDYLVRLCHDTSNLTELSVSTITMPSQIFATLTCTLVNLNRLYVRDDSLPWNKRTPNKIGALLEKFSCPALQELVISSLPSSPSLGEDIPFPKHQLVAFLARAPRLTIIEFELDLKDDILLNILAHIPAVEEVRISRYHYTLFTAAFFKRLTYVPQAAAPPLCPRLRIVRVKGYHELESGAALVDMVASRWRVADGAPVARLKRVSFDYVDPRLDGFASEGLALTYS